MSSKGSEVVLVVEMEGGRKVPGGEVEGRVRSKRVLFGSWRRIVGGIGGREEVEVVDERVWRGRKVEGRREGGSSCCWCDDCSVGGSGYVCGCLLCQYILATFV